MEWLSLTGKWYLYLFVMGLVFFPMSRLLFPRFVDRGYAFSKTIAILVLTYTSFVLGVTKLAPFNQISIYILFVCFAFVNFALLMRQLQKHQSSTGQSPKSKKSKKLSKNPFPAFIFDKKVIYICLFEEVMFVASLFFLAYVRGMEPSIRGLEKFMDFGFISSALRSNYFPPLDMWLSADPSQPGGYPINYYYFGHLTGAYLIRFIDVSPFVGYNLILATIFAQGVTLVFSLASSFINFAADTLRSSFRVLKALFIGVIGTFIVNLGGNLHTIYLFTTGYPNEDPVPFWSILPDLSGAANMGEVWMRLYNPTKYWYPNATRFIPFTIHEFPSYSYVVADLHGHVFDIPFVITTLALLLSFFMRCTDKTEKMITPPQPHHTPKKHQVLQLVQSIPPRYYQYSMAVLFGFMAAVHYMTNAIDGLIYVLLVSIVFVILFRFSRTFFISTAVFAVSLVIFALPFSMHFAPFASGIGVNCAPDFLVKMEKIGPFLFEAGKCQSTPIWMLFVLWGFFWVSLLLLVITTWFQKNLTRLDRFAFLLFIFGTFLILIPEFFYIKDIYPDHFRANTMFKLGYQAFIMMGVASAYTMYKITSLTHNIRYVLKFVFLFFMFFIVLYPFYAFPSYYGKLNYPENSQQNSLQYYLSLAQEVELDGSVWLRTYYPEDKEIIDFLLTSVSGQPVILEAQGDSYTDYARISAYTGFPTVAGWWVHEWLWRGSADVVGQRIPEIALIYESDDTQQVAELLKKYRVEFVIVASQERTKYPELNEEKFLQITEKIFETSDQKGAVYRVENDRT